jgi:hypothetical protein
MTPWPSTSDGCWRLGGDHERNRPSGTAPADRTAPEAAYTLAERTADHGYVGAMAATVPDITGGESELLERLRVALERVEERDRDSLRLVVLPLLLDLMIRVERDDLGLPTMDGVIGAIGHRALEVVDFGVAEGFLVRALRDRITRFLAKQSDTGAISAWRAEMLEAIGDELSPSMRESFGPLNADKVSESWGNAHFWAQIVEELLSDHDIELWESRHGAAAYRRTLKGE